MGQPAASCTNFINGIYFYNFLTKKKTPDRVKPFFRLINKDTKLLKKKKSKLDLEKKARSLSWILRKKQQKQRLSHILWKVGALRNYAKFTRQHLYRTKFSGLQPLKRNSDTNIFLLQLYSYSNLVDVLLFESLSCERKLF